MADSGFFDNNEKDMSTREEERLARSLNRKKEQGNVAFSKKPSSTASAAKPTSAPAPVASAAKTSSSSAAPNWKLNEEERRTQEEERQKQLKTKREEEERQRNAYVEEQIAQRRQQEDEERRKRESEFLHDDDPDKRIAEQERIKREEDAILRRMYRATPGRTGPTPEEVAEHQRKIDEMEAQDRRKVEEEQKQEERQQKNYDVAHPKYTVDEKQLLDLIAELNKVRVSPKLYVKYLQQLIDDGAYQGNTLKVPGGQRETTEGVEGAKKAIEQLKTAQRLKMFSHSDGLSQSCYDLIRDHNPQGLTGNNLSDGTSAQDRLNKYGKLAPPSEELFAYGFHSPEDLVLQWILDDGDFSRRRRNIVLNPQFTILGISIGPHSKHKNMVAAVFATEYVANKPE